MLIKRANKYFIAIILSTLCFYVWIAKISLSPTLPIAGDEPIFYSNQCHHDLRLTILHAINQATTSLHMVMFGLSDPSIISSIRKHIDKGMDISLYYDKRSSSHLSFPQRISHGVKSSGLLHQKILVLDKKRVFLGSANMTKSSLSMHDNLVIGLFSPDISNFLISHTPHSSGNIRTMVGGQDVELWLLPDIKNKALNGLKSLIHHATTSIHLVMFTLTHPILLEELIKSKKKGVNVSVTIDYQSSLGASAKAIEKLKSENIKVTVSTGMQLLHHKYAYIDDRILITGSANWTKAAFLKNKDCFVILYNLTRKQKKFMNKLEKVIALETK